MATVTRDQRAFARRLKEARVGDTVAQYEVALMYANGVGVDKSLDEAMVWTEAAAKKGHTAAQYLLGTAYQGGLGIKRNSHQALTWLLKATESGSDKAPQKLAKLLTADADGIAAEFRTLAASRGVLEAQLEAAQRLDAAEGGAQAFEWYLKAAEGGLASAQVVVAEYFTSTSTQSDRLEQAREWYRRAAAQGHPGAFLALLVSDSQDAGRGRGSKQGNRKAPSRDRRSQSGLWDQYAAHADSREQYHLGLMYREGRGVSKSLRKARSWFERSAHSGLADAQVALAELLSPTSKAEARHWYTLAAAQGSAAGQLALGLSFEMGEGQRQSLSDALHYYLLAARQGDAVAQHRLALLLADRAEPMVVHWLDAAAGRGSVDALYALGERYAQGVGVNQDWVKAVSCFEKAAAQGNAGAQCALATCLADGLGVKVDLALAVSWFERAAEQDHARAQWRLGEVLARGGLGVMADPARATLLCKSAAMAGFAPAQATLAALFAKAKEYERAVHWWALAAEQEDPEALFNLAHAHRVGWVKSGEDESLVLLHRAAKTGLVVAQARLGHCYATGNGAPEDAVEATKWFILAANAGDASAGANFLHAQSSLSPEQLREAQRRAKEWAEA